MTGLHIPSSRCTIITLKRVIPTGHATFGVLHFGDGILTTLELPWLDNKRHISCIPPGKYAVIPWDSPVHGKCWRITNVPDRGVILFHKGNYVRQTNGCVMVAVGMDLERQMITRSGKGWKLLNEYLNKWQNAILYIN